MSEDQWHTLRVSDVALLQIEGLTVLDRHGMFLTWNARVVDGMVEATIRQRDATLWERLRWAFRPEPRMLFIR